ncbi:putative malate:quinone oxidoreductase OS=Lysinibacillus sphaericus OX=1421 GN=mqo1 PE=3 SV=1 [Lysinibacillus sphaericus]
MNGIMQEQGMQHYAKLTYTSEKPDGTIDISKAINVNEQFQVSMQFWSYLVKNKLIQNPQDFIMPLPHMSMVRGEKNVEYLRKRYETMSNNPLFKGMEFSDNPEKLKEWIPLIMEDRPANEAIAATKIDTGTDVYDFGALTRILFDHLKAKDVDINYNHSVESIKRTKTGLWELKVHDKDGCKMEYHTAKFVFLGAGGGKY